MLAVFLLTQSRLVAYLLLFAEQALAEYLPVAEAPLEKLAMLELCS
jgi:hypothetical protein